MIREKNNFKSLPYEDFEELQLLRSPTSA
ncbi:hypothetical protein KR51_00028320, partial [Rubidibacter lacunae KORDI 51-2]